MPKIEDTYLVGREHGPIHVRVIGDDDGTARELIGFSRVVLGKLKQRMQLAEIDSDMVLSGEDTKRLPSGAVVHVKSIIGRDGQADIDSISIDVSGAGEERKYRCLGYIVQGIFDMSAAGPDYRGGLSMSYKVTLPSGKVFIRDAQNPGDFEGYPDFNSKYDPVTTESTAVYVRDVTRTHSYTSTAPDTYIYTGPGDASLGVSLGWSVTRAPEYYVTSCTDDSGSTIAYLGSYQMRADLINVYFTHDFAEFIFVPGNLGNFSSLTVDVVETVRSDVGYGIYYTGALDRLGGAIDICVPSNGGLLASPWYGVYPDEDAWLQDWENIRRKTIMDEIALIATEDARLIYDAWIQEYNSVLIPSMDNRTYELLTESTHGEFYNFETICKHPEDLGAMTSLGFFFSSDGKFLLSDPRESVGSTPAGSGVLFMIGLSGEDLRFQLSQRIIELNTTAFEHHDIHDPPVRCQPLWDNIVVDNVLDPGTGFSGSGGTTWGGPTNPIAQPTIRAQLENYPPNELTGFMSFDILQVGESRAVSEPFGIPIRVESGEHRVALYTTSDTTDFPLQRIRVYLYLEGWGVYVVEYPGSLLNPDTQEFDSGLSINIGDYRAISDIIKTIPNPV